MHARPAPLFDASRSALLLRAGPGSDPLSTLNSKLPPNAMRANDLRRTARSGSRASPLATYGSAREPVPWKP